MWKNADAVLFESFALPRARCEQRPLKVNDPTLSVEQLQRRAMSGRWQRRASVSLATASHFLVEKKGTRGHSGLSPVLGLSVTNCGCSFQESVRGELPDGSDSHDPPPWLDPVKLRPISWPHEQFRLRPGICDMLPRLSRLHYDNSQSNLC